MDRRQWIWAGVGTAALAAGAGWSWLHRTPGASLPTAGSNGPGSTAGTAPGAEPPPQASADAAIDTSGLWSVTLEQPTGSPLRLAALKGRPLLVNFWATWCAPCVKEMPLLDRHAQEHPQLALVGIAVDRMEAVRSFLQRTPVRFPIGVAGFAGTELARTLGNPQGALPYTVLIGRDGRVLARRLGETHAEDLQAWSRLAQT